MPLYRVHFVADNSEPFPPLDTLPSVDAADPLAAVEELLRQGRVPQMGIMRWARVVLNVHENGRPRQVLRFAITPERVQPIEWEGSDREGL
jgi:hypothetical protein